MARTQSRKVGTEGRLSSPSKIERKDLPFASKIQILNKYKSYLMFKKNFWIKKNDVKSINHKIKNFIHIVNLFRNIYWPSM